MTVARPRHLLGIEALRREEIEFLLSLAEGHAAPKQLTGKIVANLFFEDSTRTRSSFEIAAKSLGAEVLNWTAKSSSLSKGESLLDTVKNVDAMGPAAIVIRHGSSGAALLASKYVNCAVINAGDGTHEHPSQALLDALALKGALGSLEGKTVAIVGDLLHSRVARSNLWCLTKLGVKVILSGPPTLLPPELGATYVADMDQAMEGVDAVMMLRLQLERQSDAMIPSAREYARRWGLTRERAARLAPHAVIMHPGPINRGVELAPEVADGNRSIILEQVRLGVAMRRAILEWCT